MIYKTHEICFMWIRILCAMRNSKLTLDTQTKWAARLGIRTWHCETNNKWAAIFVCYKRCHAGNCASLHETTQHQRSCWNREWLPKQSSTSCVESFCTVACFQVISISHLPRELAMFDRQNVCVLESAGFDSKPNVQLKIILLLLGYSSTLRFLQNIGF